MVALLFDAEGVVIDTMRSVWIPGDKEFLRRRNLCCSEALMAQLTGQSISDGTRVMQSYFGFGGDVDELVQERLVIARELFSKDVRFIEGFETFFARVRHFPCAIATSLKPEFLHLVDQHLNLSALFDGHLYSIYQVGARSKPNPDIFLHAARELAVPPSECIVFEDAPHGVEAARRAGMRCVALTTSFRRELLKGATIIVERFEEIDKDFFKNTL